jgi:hypothetical protein
MYHGGGDIVLAFELFTTTTGGQTGQSTRTRAIKKQGREIKHYIQNQPFSGRLGGVFAEREGEGIIISEQLSKTTVIGDESRQNAKGTTSLANGVASLEVGYRTEKY